MKDFQKNWQDLIKPKKIEKEEKSATPFYSKFICEPLERGYGVTLGNALRRVLLSSLEGSAVTMVTIKGVDHEFSTMKGVTEDVTEIVLNIKKLIVRMQGDEPKTMKLSAKKAGQVTAGMIETDPSIEIANKDLVIATLTEDVDFEIEMLVEMVKRYLKN